MPKLTTFLMFEGRADEAVTFYMSLFDDSKIESIVRYDAMKPALDGKVMHMRFTLAGQEFMALDSDVHHNFSFTPAMSIFVTCDDEAQLSDLFSKLSENGEIRMPLDNYGFSQKFGWTDDRFGVSWQLNLQ